MHPSFHSLPDEILEKILSRCDSQVTLRNLTVTSRQCYRVFFPYLYRHIRIWDAPKSKNLRVLARTLLANHDVASRVQSFTFRYSPLTKEDINEICVGEEKPLKFAFLRSQPATRMERLRQDCGQGHGKDGNKFDDLCWRTIQSFGSSSPWKPDIWLTSLGQADEDALVMLLLLVMPNLRRIDLQISKCMNYGIWQIGDYVDHGAAGPVDKSSAPGGRFLGQVTEAFLGVDKDRFGPENIAGIKLLYWHLMNPSMQKVCVRNLLTSPPDMICEYVEALHLAPMSSSVTHLEVREFTIHSKNLAELVGSCRSLRTFIYEHTSVFWSPEWVDAVLSSAKTTLETLWLGFGSLRWLAANYRRPIYTLSDYTALKHLRLPMRAVFGTSVIESSRLCIVDLIPPSLEILHLKDCNYKRLELIEALEELLARRNDRFPALREIMIDTPFDDLASGFSEILNNAAQNGILFTLRDISPGPSYKDKGWGFDESENWYGDNGTKTSYRSRRAIYPEIVRERYSSKATGELSRVPRTIVHKF